MDAQNDAHNKSRINELQQALQRERDALRRERELSALTRKRCELLEDSVRRAYRLAAGGRRPREMETGN